MSDTVRTSVLSRIFNRVRIELRKFRLHVANHVSVQSVVCPDGPVVSLTTFGDRMRQVYLTIESIAEGETLPGRLILSLDENSEAPVPRSLRRLLRRGLEIQRVRDYGPHKKYYSYLETASDLRAPLVTADDDVLYPRAWLSQLMGSYETNPSDISCHRASRISLSVDGFAPYATWKLCNGTVPSILNFATGVSGVLYPPGFQRVLKAEGTAFLQVAPRADDIWLHKMAVREGYAVRQVNSTSRHFDEIRRSETSALLTENVLQGGNDRQILATYSAEDIAKLRREEVGLPTQPTDNGRS